MIAGFRERGGAVELVVFLLLLALKVVAGLVLPPFFVGLAWGWFVRPPESRVTYSAWYGSGASTSGSSGMGVT